MNSIESVGPLNAAPRIDLSEVVRLRRRVSHAATSLKIIGFLSAMYLLVYSSGYFGFVPALLCAMLVPGLANATARRLRSGSVRAAALAAAWCLLWFGVNAFDGLPKALKGGLDVYSFLGGLVFGLPPMFLAWGLIAFARYHPSTTDGEATLLAHPWEEGLRIKVRPRFVRWTAGAVLFLVLSPLPYLWLWASQVTHEPTLVSDPDEQLGRMLGASMVVLAVVYWDVRIYRRARRKAMLPGSALIKKDARPIVLYLRSFHDDTAIRLRARATNGRILPERLVRVPFEEVVTDHLWGYGPVLAIGDPQQKDKTALLGAARDSATDADWQNRAIELMQQASLIVAIAGKTGGLAWEIDALVSRGFLSKFVLLLPPVNRREIEARWRFLASNTSSLPAEIDFDHTRAAIFPKGRLTLVRSDKARDWTYEAVLDQAALGILGTAQIRPATSPSLVTPESPFSKKLAREVLSFARSAFAFVAIGAVVFIVYGANLIRTEVARPYAHSGKDRDEFIAETINNCGEDSGLSGDALGRYCSCYAKRLADAITYGELEALLDSKPSILGRDLKASFNQKVKTASATCLKEALRQGR
jgi:hypothetical protein